LPQGWRLQDGSDFSDATVSYTVWGKPNAHYSNVVLVCTSFGSDGADIGSFLVGGSSQVLDCTQYCVVCIDTFGNGSSASPSSANELFLASPQISMHDNVVAQRWVLTEHLQLLRDAPLALVYGYSMGGCLALEWAVSFSHQVARASVVCGAAKCGDLNKVFLGSLRTPLRQGEMEQVGRVYAGWGVGPRFYHNKCYIQAGDETVEDFIDNSYVSGFKNENAADLLVQLETWYHHDVSKPFGGDTGAALGRITALVGFFPCDQDAYFTVHETRAQAALIPNCRFRASSSPHGHRSGDPHRSGQEPDYEWIKCNVHQLLQTTVQSTTSRL